MADLFLGRPRSRRYPKFNIRRDTSPDPGEFLLWAAQGLANELAILAGNSGQALVLPESFPRMPMKDVAPFSVYLQQRKIIPDSLVSPIRTVVQGRNSVLQGKLSGDTVSSLAELANDVLLKLRKINRYYYRVALPHVALYRGRDRSGLHSTHGVMIVTPR